MESEPLIKHCNIRHRCFCEIRLPKLSAAGGCTCMFEGDAEFPDYMEDIPIRRGKGSQKLQEV